MEVLIQRLVADPQDQQALAIAHQAGSQDPRAYAILLEKVGTLTPTPAIAAHWLSEAASVWSMTLGDPHHAARTLMLAIEKDPSQQAIAERLAQLYREKGDTRGLVALQERRAKVLAAQAQDPGARAQLAAIHEELGRLWGEPPLLRPERAVENYRRLVELDPSHVYGIYAVREMLKQLQQYAEALPYFAMEHGLVEDPERRLALYRDEADVRKRIEDFSGAAQALRGARALRPDDAALTQELGLLILEAVAAGRATDAERLEAAQIFVGMSETYGGEYGFGYAVSALKAQPGNDRALQLAVHWGASLGKQAEIKPLYSAYLAANPQGFMAAEARQHVGSVPPPAPQAATPAPPPATPAPAPSFGAPSAPAQPSFGAQPSAPAQPSFGAQPSAPAQPSFGAQPSAPAQPSFGAQAPAPSFGAQPAPPVAQPSTPDAGASPQEIASLLAEAQAEAQKARKPQALQKFREVLKLDPAHPDALAWVEEHLRQKRQYNDLRDVLFAAAKVASVSPDTRKSQLREVAGICESQLRDIETAIQAWKLVCQIDRSDDQAREQLRRLLEKGARWDELATVLEQDAMQIPDVEQKIALEKKLATLHEQKRKDLPSAAEAWARIAALTPGDDAAVTAAVKLFERGDRLDLAAQTIADNLVGLEDKQTRGSLLQKLGELRTKLNDPGGAGDALAEAADIAGTAKLWEQAEKAFLSAERWVDAANAVERRAELEGGRGQAALFAQAGELLLKAGDAQTAIERFEKAAEAEPANDGYAQKLEELFVQASREADLVAYLLGRADKLPDKGKRVASRRRAADIQRGMGDRDGARQSLLALLGDGDDEGALRLLIEDAEERGDHQELVDLLRRLSALVKEPAEKLTLSLREASVLADELNDVDAAVERYEAIVKAQDPKNRTALRAIADLEERRDNWAGAANALERELALVAGEERGEIAQRLAKLYEGPIDDPKRAITALEVVCEVDPEDFDAVARLLVLAERVEDWPKVATLLAALVEVEGDEEECARLTLRHADVLHKRLGRGDEALAALERLADEGNEAVREAYVDLADALGWKGIVATKLVAWNEAAPPAKRNDALRQAFKRFVEVGRKQDACKVAVELARTRGAERELGFELERIATEVKDLDALSVSHELLLKELSGAARAEELVRQAETLVAAGVDPLEAMQHGEAGLTSVPAAEVEALLERLAKLTQAPGHVVDLYERQVGRCRTPADRLGALARASQVAARLGAMDRARGFFEIALGGGVQEETIQTLSGAARSGDEAVGGNQLRRLLAEALAAGGQGSRDGGRTRSALLRRAASIAHEDLGDVDKAFGWIGDAVVAHVDDASLDALDALGRATGDLPRVEKVLSKGLDEVFDGPLVRKLLQRRARLRRDVLGDTKGAAVDLKKLHDLSPSDLDVMNELSAMLTTLGDHRGMIQLYEDQILRGRDPAARAELARKVARLWEEELADAREAADAWRRVLRMKAGDPEATAGLDRAKTGKLQKGTGPRPSLPEPKPALPTPAPAKPEPKPLPVPVVSAPAEPVHDGDTDRGEGGPDPVHDTAPHARVPSMDAIEPAPAAPPAFPAAAEPALAEPPAAPPAEPVAPAYAEPAPPPAFPEVPQPQPPAFPDTPAAPAYGEAYPGHAPQEHAFAAEPAAAPAGHDGQAQSAEAQPQAGYQFPPEMQPVWDPATQQYIYPPGYAEAYATYLTQTYGAEYAQQYLQQQQLQQQQYAAQYQQAPAQAEGVADVDDAELIEEDDAPR